MCLYVGGKQVPVQLWLAHKEVWKLGDVIICASAVLQYLHYTPVYSSIKNTFFFIFS